MSEFFTEMGDVVSSTHAQQKGLPVKSKSMPKMATKKMAGSKKSASGDRKMASGY